MSAFDSFLKYSNASSTQALSHYVLPTLRDWLKAHKGVDASVEEMLNALKIESTTLVISAPSSALTPPVAAGNGRKKANTTVNKAPEVVDPNGGCIYIFTRKAGDKNKGDRCGAPTVNGTTWCKSCSKKKGGGGGTTAAAKAGPAPGLTTVPSVVTAVVEENKTEEITANQDLIPGFMVEDNSNTVFEADKEGNFVAFGVYEAATKSVRQFTADEQSKVTAKGFRVCNDANTLNSKFHEIRSNLQTVANASLQTGLPTVTTLPTGFQNGMGFPSVSALPAGLPSVSALPAGLPSVSAIPGGLPVGFQGMPQTPVGFNTSAFPTFNPNVAFGIPITK